MIIKKAGIKDLSGIWEIYVNAGVDETRLQYPFLSRIEVKKRFKILKPRKIKGLKKSINSKIRILIVVLEKNKIIAFGEAKISKLFRKEGSLEKIYVKKEFRKKGVATKIMRELLKWLKQNKVKRVFSELYANNIPSKKFQEKFGFKINALGMERVLK